MLTAAAALTLSAVSLAVSATTAQAEVVSDPQIHVFWDQARFRDYHNGGPVPWVCVDNHSPFTLQTIAEQWDARISDGYVYYEDGNNCASFWERETIDMFGADYPGGPCIWASKTYDGNYYANVNVYLNTNANKWSQCYPSQIGSNHRKSNAIGVGLGAQSFNKFHDDTPTGIYVMDNATLESVSYAQAGDGLNWDWRY